MLNLQTTVEIPKGTFQIKHRDKIMLLGSCFADEMSAKFKECGFDTLSNPFGTLYNPASIAALLLRCISQSEYSEKAKEIFQDGNGIWHSWMHHSRFSSDSVQTLVRNLNERTQEAARFLAEANILIITFGTAIIYRLKESDMLVANCHKQPDSLFRRERLTAYDITDSWLMVTNILHSINPNLKIIFTVSPIRHKRDGMHINQISKGILLQAVDEITAEQHCYFPSYEIMFDELRDYRFYADDMIHPSGLAVEYIWQRFQETFMNEKTLAECRAALKEWKRQQHRTII